MNQLMRSNRTSRRAETTWIRRGRSRAAAAVAAAGLVALPVTPAVAGAASAAAPTSTAKPAAPPLTFAIYPGGAAGGGSPHPLPDRPAKIEAALSTLQGRQREFLVRDYASCPGTSVNQDRRYLTHGRRLDLVLIGTTMPLARWLSCVRTVVGKYGPEAAVISVTLEVNLKPTRAAERQLVAGVIAAHAAAAKLSGSKPQIGFDEVADGQAGTGFWRALAKLGGTPFTRSVGYVGVDMYPGSFNGPTMHLAAQVTDILHVVRATQMPIAGLGQQVPIRVSENGWQTDTAARLARQPGAISSMIHTVNADRAADHVLSYGLFDLRDELLKSKNPFDHLGLMLANYQPKPAFWTYRKLVAQLGGCPV